MTFKIRAGERFIPCVLSRMQDDEPTSRIDRMPRVMSLDGIREDILANVVMLLNSRSRPNDEDLSRYPEIENSVISYGLMDFCGMNCNMENLETIRKHVRDQLIKFEPRIDKESLQINVFESSDSTERCSFSMEIIGRFAISEMTGDFRYSTRFDLETGQVTMINKDM